MTARRPAVLLINPRICSRRSIRLPLSLLALGAVLEGKHRYQILDGNVEADLVGAVLRVLDGEPDAVVGVTRDAGAAGGGRRS